MMGSDAHLTDEDEEEYGRNRFKNNQNNQILVYSNDYAFLGYQWYQGRNSVYHSDPEDYEMEYVANLNTNYTVKAWYTWWGTTSPSSDMFEGSWAYSNHSTFDQTSTSGSPLAKVVAPGGAEDKPSEQQRKEMLLDLISSLEEDAYEGENDHRLSELYLHMRMDRNDKMGLRDKILGTISEWSSRRSRISSEYGDSPEVRRAVELAMLLEIRIAFRNSDYERAGQLNDAFEAYIELEEISAGASEKRGFPAYSLS